MSQQPCGPASSLLKWPDWFNVLCKHWSVMRTQGYLQLPQHSCGDTTPSVAERPYAISVQAKHNRRCGQEALKAQPLSSSHYSKKNLLTSRCGAQLPITHFYHARSYFPPHSLHTVSNHKLAWAAMVVMLKYQTTFKLVVKKHRPKATGGQFVRGKHTHHKQKCLEHAHPPCDKTVAQVDQSSHWTISEPTLGPELEDTTHPTRSETRSSW